MESGYRELVARINDIAPDGLGEHAAECVARLDTLKFHVMGLGGLDEVERDYLMRELDFLRAGYVPLGPLTVTVHESDGLSSVEDVLRPRMKGAGGRLKLEGILGQNKMILLILEKIAKIASTNLTVLLEGATGSGKELFARIIHVNSERVNMVSVNCSAIPSELVESELFGHVKGAFTGAISTRKGKFEEANGGTIFLDEIGDLEVKTQAKLLRVLDVAEIQRVGSDQTLKVDVRVIAATNKNLERMVEEGRFREDLYFRLNICHFHIPPLCERRDEVELLFEYFVKNSIIGSTRQVPTFEDDVYTYLFEVYDFPGNIRELKNLSLYLTYIFDGQPIGFSDLPDRYRHHYDLWRHSGGHSGDESNNDSRQELRERAEKEYLTSVLTQHQGDIRATCQDMALSRSRVYQLLQKHGLKITNFRGVDVNET